MIQLNAGDSANMIGSCRLRIAIPIPKSHCFEDGDRRECVFPGLKVRVLSECSDAHIDLDHGTCSPFQRLQFAFVSSGI